MFLVVFFYFFSPLEIPTFRGSKNMVKHFRLRGIEQYTERNRFPHECELFCYVLGVSHRSTIPLVPSDLPISILVYQLANWTHSPETISLLTCSGRVFPGNESESRISLSRNQYDSSSLCTEYEFHGHFSIIFGPFLFMFLFLSYTGRSFKESY